MKIFAIGIVVLLLVGAAGWWVLREKPPEPPVEPAEPTDEQAVNIDALQALGEGLDLQLTREPDKALQKLREALEKNPDLRGVRYQMAVAAFQAGDTGQAETFAAESIEHGENVADAHILRGTLAARDGRHEEAAVEFAAAVAAEPANAMAYYNWSESLRHTGRPQEALEKLAAAMSRNPGEPLYALKQRLARIEAGDGLEELRRETIAQMQLDPPSGDWLLTAAAIDLSQGETASAARMLQGARLHMQPILFVGILQEDPFFKRHKANPAVAPYLDVTIEVTPRGSAANGAAE